MQQPIVCFLLVVVGFVAGAPSSDDERIIGGIPVTPDPLGQITTFPYLVSIEDDRNHICGGFIYSPKWVVTTASCIENKVISNLVVVAGQVNLIDYDATEERLPVLTVYPYDTYDNVTRKDDIALIELSNPFTLDGLARDFIRFNEVYTDDSFTPVGTFMGWGAAVWDGGPSPRLRYADVLMTENYPYCDYYYMDEFTISTMICAASLPISLPSGETYPSSCAFDEGAPLVQTYEVSPGAVRTIVVGVLSRYSPGCDSAYSSIFTRLSVYYAWLYRTAGEQPYETTTP